MVPYNLPKLGHNPAWYPEAVTFANQSVLGNDPRGIFIDSDNAVYYANYHQNQIFIWPSNGASMQTINTGIIFYHSTLFVAMNKDVYVSNGNEIVRVDRWTNNGTVVHLVATFNQTCFGLFIDVNNTLYCAVPAQNQVRSISLNSNTNISAGVAGTGVRGSAPDQLNNPWDIFVGTNFDLYIADASNGRIQLFRPGCVNGTTVAGNGIPSNLQLSLPTGIVLDADNFLFIADNEHNRIIRAGSSSYQCIAGCSGASGSNSNQLHSPISLRFDSHGNIYVADEHNNRTQKFMLSTNSCGEYISGDRSKYG